MKVVVNRVRLGATDAQIMNKVVECRRELLGLPSASLAAAKRVFHRLRLVHQKQETTRVLTTDFGLVWHGLPPLVLASRELRLSHARGHRLESCRDHSQNAATPVTFAVFAGTNGTRHAHRLITPTGRTRRDPDHPRDGFTSKRRGLGRECALATGVLWCRIGHSHRWRARCVVSCSRCSVPFSSLGQSRPKPRSLPKTPLLTPLRPFACGTSRSPPRSPCPYPPKPPLS